MYLSILKRDLKRKRTMNVILLLFTILAVMFVSSGLNNVVTILNGIDYFFDQAGVGDAIVITQNNDTEVEAALETMDLVDSYTQGACFYLNKAGIKVNGHKVQNGTAYNFVEVLNGEGENFFDENNQQITEIKEGTVFAPVTFCQEEGLREGDTIEITLGDTSQSFELAGIYKDAVFGSQMMDNARFLLNEKDFGRYKEDQQSLVLSGAIYQVKTGDTTAFRQELAEKTDAENIVLNMNRSTLKTCFVMEVVVAILLMVLSLVLCIVSFVLLRFVISYTIAEEYREIGVMKAIGLKVSRIRAMYVVKYLGLSLMGGIIGFLAGIPFGSFLLHSVSKKMYLGNDAGLLLNLIGTLLVILVTTGFAYSCTGKIKKASPIEAIRNGQTGERYQSKSRFSLRKSKLNNAFFLAANDVFSGPKRFLTIIFAFILTSVLLFVIATVRDMAESDTLIDTLALRADVYLQTDDLIYVENLDNTDTSSVKENAKNIEEKLKEWNMPGKVSAELFLYYPITVNGKTENKSCLQNPLAEASDYVYSQGSAPQNANEVAITSKLAKELGVEIGDTVTIDFGTEKKDCMIVGYFECMDQLGEVFRLHEDAPTSLQSSTGTFAYLIQFDDNPSQQLIEERIGKLKDYYDADEIYTAAGFCDACMKISDTMDSVVSMLLILTCMVVLLVSILMEKSFMTDERNQIALLKAIGFSNGFIIRWQVERFLLVSLLSEGLALLLTYPVTRLCGDPIWNMMGAKEVSYLLKPQTVGLNLLVIFLINFFAVLVTALIENKKITCKDIRNIE